MPVAGERCISDFENDEDCESCAYITWGSWPPYTAMYNGDPCHFKCSMDDRDITTIPQFVHRRFSHGERANPENDVLDEPTVKPHPGRSSEWASITVTPRNKLVFAELRSTQLVSPVDKGSPSKLWQKKSTSYNLDSNSNFCFLFLKRNDWDIW